MREKMLTNFIKNSSRMDAGLILGQNNRFYFSGAMTSEGILFADGDTAYLLVDSRYIEYCKAEVKGCEVILLTDLKKQLKELVQLCGCKAIGVDVSCVEVARFERLKALVAPAELLPVGDLDQFIMKKRAVKDAGELANIAEAQRLLDLSYEYITQTAKIGMTEEELALLLWVFLKRHGAQATAFDFIVLSGPNTSKPHGMPGRRELAAGDLVLLDYGVKFNWYCSDMTRVFAMQKAGTKEKEVYELVLKAQKEACKRVRPGVVCSEVDKAARDIIEAGGFKKEFGHGLGHSLGLNIHEDPNFNPSCKTVLEPGMVLTLEPGVYLEEEFGVRIEDTVFVTEEGCNDITKSFKSELLVI